MLGGVAQRGAGALTCISGSTSCTFLLERRPARLGAPGLTGLYHKEGEPVRDAGQHGPTCICLSLSKSREHGA